MQTTKHWYQSKTIIASILVQVISALELTVVWLEGGSLDQTAIITIVMAGFAIYGRIVAKDEIE